MIAHEELSAVDRRAQIAQMVLERDGLRVSNLVAEFGVTDTSIRRDLIILESEGRLRRVHGGAVAVRNDQRARWYTDRMRQHLEQKQRIGAAGAQLISPGDVLLFDSGTTTLQVVAHIPMQLRTGGTLTLVTNSVPLADEVRAWPSSNLILLGGLYLPDYQATVGPQAVEQLRSITADKVFLGAEGLTLEEGISTAHILMAETDQILAQRARQVIVTTDSSKLGRAGFVPIIRLNQVHILVTDTNAPPEVVEGIRAQGVDVRLV
jgi:DeoR/GlpR family transcriptional regulator of sugar metabolism